MTTEQLEKLLKLYKKAIENKLTAEDFVTEIQSAEIQLDQSFVKNGKSDKNLGVYIEELYNLQKLTTNA